jgi:hypothetical protein
VVTAPEIAEPLTTGQFAIVDDLSRQSANNLLDQLLGK